MSECLGLYVEENLIKYAKVSEDNNVKKVDAFGIKFYDNFDEAINQIIEETYSFKTPICVNVEKPEFDSFEIFGMLNKKDREDIIKTEFENICLDKSTNIDSYEKRHIYTEPTENKEKIKVLHISTQKTDIAHQKNKFANFKLSSIEPIELAIVNLIKQEKDENSIIVNIEENTKITTIKNNMVRSVKIVPIGSKEILKQIDSKENSMAKSYEICKNATIYTNDAKDLQYEDNDYLEQIMPTLYNIVQELKKVTEQNLENVNKIYITGTMAVVNNIDIYFQDYFRNSKCEILKPYFISNNSKINIKDYIEVNSAIALAIQGMKKETVNTNFLNKKKQIMDILKSNVTLSSFKDIKIDLSKFSRPIGIVESFLITLLIVYILFGITFNNLLEKKANEANKQKEDTKQKIATLQSYNDSLTKRKQRFDELISNIEAKSQKASDSRRYKNAIPTLLNNISKEMPKGVEIDSIENTSTDHITIVVTATEYEQIGFLKAKLENSKILLNVVSDSGVINTVKNASKGTITDYITVTIEGDLP